MEFETIDSRSAIGREVNAAIGREIEHAEDKYGQYHDDLRLGDWIIIVEKELAEAKEALCRGEFGEAQCELLQAIATGVNAMIYLGGPIERRDVEFDRS